MVENGTYIVPTQLIATRPIRLADGEAYWSALNAPAHMRMKIRKYRDASEQYMPDMSLSESQ